jgi:hypothetical protein
MRGGWELSDAPRRLIEPILHPKWRADGRRRPCEDTRAVLTGILWVLGTGAQWRETAEEVAVITDLPSPFPTVGAGGQTGAHLTHVARELQAREKLDLEEAFIDASFTGAKKGALRSGPPDAARGAKSSLSAMITVFGRIESASPHQSQLVQGLLEHSFLDTLPARLMGDKAYDSDRLDRDLAERDGIEMIARIAECGGNPPKTAALLVAIADLANDVSLGSIIFVGS